MPIIQSASESQRNIPEELLPIHDLHHIDLSGFSIRSGIYFLVSEGTVVYIGQSINVIARILSHISENVKQFDSVFFIPVPIQSLSIVEGAFIRTYRPVYNTGMGKLQNNDTRIVNALMFGEASQYNMERLPLLMSSWGEREQLDRRKERGFKAGDVILSMRKEA